MSRVFPILANIVITCIMHISTIIDQKFTNISTLPNYAYDSRNLGIYIVTKGKYLVSLANMADKSLQLKIKHFK